MKPGRIALMVYGLAESTFLSVDKRLIRRTKNLHLVPGIVNRKGGQRSYGEWCYLVGIFQCLLYRHLNQATDNEILDVGCGNGILGIAVEPYLGQRGRYSGIDVSRECIAYCKSHYPSRNFCFQHLDYANPTYAPQQGRDKKQWDISDEAIDLVTALSVWTHLQEHDAIFYFREIDRVLRPGGKAIVTFFLLDDIYYGSLATRTGAQGRYHNTPQNRWIFDVPCSEHSDWFHPAWVRQPEDAIGVTPRGIQVLLKDTELSLEEIYIGTWKEIPSLFFQDVMIFAKQSIGSSIAQRMTPNTDVCAEGVPNV